MADISNRYGNPARDRTAALRGAEATLNEQLARDIDGKYRDEVLDELAVAAQSIEGALQVCVDGTNACVLRELLDAVRLSESVVTQTWDMAHG